MYNHLPFQFTHDVPHVSFRTPRQYFWVNKLDDALRLPQHGGKVYRHDTSSFSISFHYQDLEEIRALQNTAFGCSIMLQQ